MRLALSGMLALAVAIGIGRFAFTPLLPMMQKDYGVTLRLAGLLAAANYVGYFIGALSAIWVRARPATMVGSSLLATVALTAAMGGRHDASVWLLLRGLAGVASAWILVFGSAWILQQLALAGKKSLGGVVFGGVGLGTAFTGALCVIFLYLDWHADRAWWVLGAVALLLAGACWPGFRVAVPAGTTAASVTAQSLQLRDHAAVVTCYAILGFGYIIPATFLPAMARQAIADPVLFGWAWPAFGSAALVSTLLAGWLSAHLSNRRIWALAHAVMAVGVATPVLLPGMAGIAISALCVGGTFMVATMAGMQEARALAPDRASQLIAAMTTAFALGQILGPLLVSLVSAWPNGMGVLLITAALLLLGSAAVLARGARKSASG